MRKGDGYGGPAAATASHGAWTADGRRFPWLAMIFLWILAVLLVLGLCKYGIDYTPPYVPSAAPTSTYEPPTLTIASTPLARTG